MNTREAFVRNLRRLMEEHGVNQIQLATNLGVSSAAVSNWFNGKKFPRPAILEKLAILFVVDTTDLLTSPDDRGHHIDRLSEDERKVIKLYTSIPDDKKRMAIELLEVIAKY